MRARQPDREGHVESHGTRIFWEEHGQGERAVLFIPPWQIVDSRVWKLQIPYFARYFRTLTFDAPGTGRSDRPATGYDHDRMADHARAVLDAAGVERASLVCLSRSTWPGAILAARARRAGRAAGPHRDDAGRRAARRPRRSSSGVTSPRGGTSSTPTTGARTTASSSSSSWPRSSREPHSTKAREDGVAWGLGTTPEILIATVREWSCRSSAAELLARVHAPTLIIHGTEDAVRPFRARRARARRHRGLGAHAVRGLGSLPPGPRPGPLQPGRPRLPRAAGAAARPGAGRWPGRRRALFVSSPIGLGHSLRDVAIARELRAQQPDLEIHWLAQDPVTRVLEARGETVHPASRLLAGESAAHRVRGRRARPARVPGLAEHGRDPARQLHGPARRAGDRALRPRDRRRGLGDRPLSPREPGAEADRVRLAHRLRGLAARGRRSRLRRRRGSPPTTTPR